jgi:hypothetical protein
VAGTQEDSVERVREYLRRLTPQARSSLLTEIERMQLYGEDISGSAVILAELRAEFRRGGEQTNRVSNPSRHFFKPIETLFVDRSPERVNAGQISRGSLAPIWEWITQVLLPAMARDYCEAMKEVLVADNAKQANLIAAGFQSKVVKCLEGTLASEEGLKLAQLGLGKFTSSRASLSELMKILSALQMRDAIAAFNAALPAKIDDLEGGALTKMGGLLDAFVAKHPQALPFALTIIIKHLKKPWQLAHLAIQASHSRTAEDIAASRYGSCISVVLDHLDDRRWILKQALKGSRIQAAKEILDDIYDVEYQLHDWIVLLDKSEWGKRLDEIMAGLALDLNAEFKTLPGNTHHVLETHALHRPAAGFLRSLSWKGRDALAGATNYGRSSGPDHKKAG